MIQATVTKTWIMTCVSFGIENVIFPHGGDEWTEAEEQCALEFVIFNANVPLLLSNRLAVKVQKSCHGKTKQKKSHGSSCLAKQRQRMREMVCKKNGRKKREGGSQRGKQRGKEKDKRAEDDKRNGEYMD